MPFRDITGHQALLALLARAASRDTLPQSLIFSGPDGVGKKLTAIALAQALNCTQTQARDSSAPDAGGGDDGIDACGVCSICRRVALGTHPDVRVIPSAIKVDDIRDVIDSSGYRPFEGKRRVFILDEADGLSNEIQNALLKTLEEPPRSSSFILVTSRPDLLLPTVRSRCPILRFGRLPTAQVERWLQDHKDVDAATAHAAAFAAEGSLGRALVEMSDEGAAARQVVEAVWQHVQGSRSPMDKLRAAQLLLEPGERPRGRAKPGTTRAASDRELLGTRLQALGALLRDAGAIATGTPPAMLSHAVPADVEQLASRSGLPRVLDAFAAVGRAQEALDRNVSPKTIADWLAFQL